MSYYTVTAVHQDSEIGYGEGESDAYAVHDCIDSIGSAIQFYNESDIRLIVRRSTGEIAYVTDLCQYGIDTGIN